MNRLQSLMAAALATVVIATPASAHSPLAVDITVNMYDLLPVAQKHCPGDTVVWINLPTRVFHLPGTRYYGTTKNGKYACLGEVKQDPEFRGSASGQ